MNSRLLATACLLASSAAATLGAAETPQEDVVTLEAFTTHARAEDPLAVLPTRTTQSLFGTDQTVLDTPRSITLLEGDLMSLYGVQTVNDFVGVTAGTFTGNYFGVPGALDVRGERADNFFRGFRRVENRGNFPTVISSTDFVEIIKGPPPPIYGGGKVGGTLNFYPKTAKSETTKLITAPTGKLSVTLGNYEKRQVQAEYGAPFTIFGKKAGIYTFASDENSKSYYSNIYNKDLIGQVAVNVELTDTLEAEFGGMVQHSDLNQSLGWNRVTQDLIDHGDYLAGSPKVNLVKPGENAIGPNDIAPFTLLTFAFTTNFAPIFLNSPQYAGVRDLYALDPATVHTVHLDHHQVQAELADFAKTDATTGYFDLVDHLGHDTTLKNQTFTDFMNHLKYSTYGFTARYKDYVFENKTTFDNQVELGAALKLKDVVGFSFRYTDGDEGESRDQFQVMNRRDISAGPTPNTRFVGAYNTNVGYNWREIGASGDWGAFALIEATLHNRLTLTLAGRDDRVTAHTWGTDNFGAYARGQDTDTNFTYNLSLSYKITPGLVPYVTHAKSRYIDLGQGGMIPSPELAGHSWIQPSTLDELGVKFDGLGGKLFVTAAVYKQQKSDYDSEANQHDFYHARGLEAELRFTPTKHWSFTGAATWQRTDVLNPPFFVSIPPSVLGFTDPSLAYAGNFNGVGALLGLKSPLRVPGPDRIFSLFGTYLTSGGLGVTFGGTYVSSYYAGFFQQVKLPAYTVCRAAVFYNINRHWSAMLQVNNLFNANYYTPQFLFQEVFISPSQGITGYLTTAYKW